MVDNRKQKIYCESTLARCQEDGIKELFGLTGVEAAQSVADAMTLVLSVPFAVSELKYMEKMQ